MPIRLANSRHICSRIAKILQNLPPDNSGSRRSSIFGQQSSNHQRYAPIHGSQLVVIKSTKELGFALSLRSYFRIHFNTSKSLQQRIGTVDSLIASHPVVLRSICTRITNKVQRLHQLIIGTTTTQHIIASQQRIIQERLLWKSIDIIQVLIYGS